MGVKVAIILVKVIYFLNFLKIKGDFFSKFGKVQIIEEE